MFQSVLKTIAYIDGFNLYYGLKERNWKKYYWLDIRSLSLSLLKPHQKLVEVKYFTSRVSSTPKDPDKSRRQNTFIEAVETLHDVRIFYGHYLTKTIRCRKCNSEWFSPEEKMTDVNIATELIVDAFHDRFDLALLISGDSDLVHPLQTVRKLFPQKKIIIAFPPSRFSKHLSYHSNAYVMIGRKKLADSQLPESVTKRDGHTLRRPEAWR
jgi:uncharacterized LabA/DUF88 family protein